MSNGNDNEFNQHDFDQDYQEKQQDGQVDERLNNQSRKPWNNKFGENENLKNRQYSRTARNQPVKEASKLSQILLVLITIIVLIPFILFGIIQSQRDNDKITSRTTNEIMISRNESYEGEKEKTKEETKKKEETTEQEEVTALPAIETTVAAIAQPNNEPEQSQNQNQTSGKTHTVAAGESWYGIARNYGIDVYTLAQYNNSSIDSSIYPGTVIQIP